MTDEKKQIKGVSATALAVIFWKKTCRKKYREYAQQPGKREKPLFKDTVMKHFVTPEVKKHANSIFEKNEVLALAVRHRFFSKTLSGSVNAENNPTKQVIILGSGCDTRAAYKKKFTTDQDVKFFEVDKPEVLQYKKHIYDNNEIDPNATFIEMDYTNEGFIDELEKSGVDFSLPTHFIWEGNTMYLEEAQIHAVIEKIKSKFPLFKLSFDYLHKAVIEGKTGVESLDKTAALFKESGAGWKSGFDEVDSLCDQHGLTKLNDITSAQLAIDYEVDEAPNDSEKYYSMCTLSN